MASPPPALGLSVPLFNEEDCCEAVVSELVGALREARIRSRLALVDNGSTDGTGGLVNRLALRFEECRALHLSPNAGYGGGILAGLRSLNAPVMGWLWGDGQVAPQVVVGCYRALSDAGADLAKARRTERRDGRRRLAVSLAYNGLMRAAFGLETDDANGCPKLFTRDALRRIEPRSTDWFLDPEVMLRAAELGLEVVEVDAVMEARPGGVSKVRWDTAVEFLDNLSRWRRGWRP